MTIEEKEETVQQLLVDVDAHTAQAPTESKEVTETEEEDFVPTSR